MYKKFLKRVLDLVICVLAFPLFIIIFIVVGILIKLEDGGPVLYKSERIGKDFEVFNMYKFRTMKINAPKILNDDGSTYNAEDDERVTKLGKILRETSIDETAQIINILIGQMSVVGPRASLSGAIGTFKNDEMDKMSVRPGVTGLTQAYYRNNLTSREKRVKDANYAKSLTFIGDLKIIVKTFFTILKRDGIYTNSTKKDEK